MAKREIGGPTDTPYMVVEDIDKTRLAGYFRELALQCGREGNAEIAGRVSMIQDLERTVARYATRAEAEAHAAKLNEQNIYPGVYYRDEHLDYYDPHCWPVAAW